MSKIENNKNGAISKGNQAAQCFEREVAKTIKDNVHYPHVCPVTKDKK
jgi:hypothetical protein